MTKSDKEILNLVAQSIYDKKGFNILALDVRGLSNMTDYFLIAEGSVNRHVKSLYSAIKDSLSLENVHIFQVDGVAEGEWIVMDCGSFIVHLLTPELREKYAIEELWSQSKIIDLDIVVELSYPPNNSRWNG